MTGEAGRASGPPKACPGCGSSRIARIQYGEPKPSAQLDADIEAGRVVLGGCCIDDHSPRFRCLDCGSGLGGLSTSSDEPAPDTFAAAVFPAGSLSDPRTVGRLVLTGNAASKKLKPDPARLLEVACEEMARREARVRYLLTPAGFLKLGLAPGQARSHGWRTERADFRTLIDIATYEVSRRLGGQLRERVAAVADHLVIGVDLFASDDGGKRYGETALVVRSRDGKVVGWTGKSYPTTEQQSHLIRNDDAPNHLIRVGKDRVAILVCHDLVAFGKRSEKNRRHVRACVGEQLENVLSEGPSIVLHLPHTLDAMKTWGPAWNRLLHAHGTPTTVWASAVKYRTAGDLQPEEPMRRRLLETSSSGYDSVLDIVLGDYATL